MSARSTAACISALPDALALPVIPHRHAECPCMPAPRRIGKRMQSQLTHHFISCAGQQAVVSLSGSASRLRQYSTEGNGNWSVPQTAFGPAKIRVTAS